MVRIKPFRGIRPPKNYAAEVASTVNENLMIEQLLKKEQFF